MLEIPVEGRLWLPPDTESAESLFYRLREFHAESAKAVDRGQDFVSAQSALAAAAANAALATQAIAANIGNREPVTGGNFIIYETATSHPATQGDTWLLVIALLTFIAVCAIWFCRSSSQTFT